ncbi:DUF4129 domain-containing protein [Mycobacterium sp. MYCO198283]|uniref:DUF4129 domain-containing protein n=1 Tax=Mycobacterium sp. MYCO198283 TaxID=2883505 RepID=UPI001E4062DF|nr:DUF4129 domain-containing protein [Mycobacterium sp. MYCO198283]MCG5432839.1 DUF4129 domain-containing protein [Mycobacterium sp. MYCO198283]
MPPVVIDRDAAREAAERELADPKYPKPSTLDQLLDTVRGWLSDLIAAGADTPGGWFTVVVVVTLVAVAAVVAVRTARRAMRTAAGADHPLFDAADLSADEHRAAAQREAAAGNWRSAIRQRLRAVARQLEQDSVLPPIAGRTATELARDAAAHAPELRDELVAAAATFDDVTFGERIGTRGAYLAIADLDDKLRRRAARHVVAERPSPTAEWAQR